MYELELSLSMLKFLRERVTSHMKSIQQCPRKFLFNVKYESFHQTNILFTVFFGKKNH